MASKTKPTTRLPSSSPARLELWVRAGGRCQFKGCNRYLVDDLDVDWRQVFLGELAHIVAAADGGPRPDTSLSEEQKNDIGNQLLLCQHCHALIDQKRLEAEFSRERLLEYKAEHELRIKQLTGIAPEHQSTVIRMLGQIRGNVPSVSPAAVRTAVVKESGRFPRYPFESTQVDIDLRQLDDQMPAYWDAARRTIDARLAALLAPAMDGGTVSHVSLFALARIPLLVYLGYALGDKIPTVVYEKQRTEGETWGWTEDGPALAFRVPELIEKPRQRAVIVLSLSGEVRDEMLPEAIRQDRDIYRVALDGTEPGRGIVRSAATLTAFRDAYQQTLRRLERAGYQHLAVIPALPMSAAVVIGREHLRGITPPTDIYDFDGSSYTMALTIGN